MENLIKENSEPGTRDSSQDSLNNSEDFHTYYMWEARSNQKDVVINRFVHVCSQLSMKLLPEMNNFNWFLFVLV